MHKRTFNATNGQRVKFKQAENTAITYTVNYAGILDTDTISSSTWTDETSGLTIANESNTTTTASARLSGTPGRYRATNKVVTAAGDTLERYVDITVLDNDDGYSTDYGSYW